jgi:hypothetical protein
MGATPRADAAQSRSQHPRGRAREPNFAAAAAAAAVRRVAWFFKWFIVVNLCLGIWGLSLVDDEIVTNAGRPGPEAKFDCQLLNRFGRLLGSWCVRACAHACAGCTGLITRYALAARSCIVEAVLCMALSIGVITLVQGFMCAAPAEMHEDISAHPCVRVTGGPCLL